MRKIGAYIAIVGILLIVLPYFDLTMMYLSKIDELGETTAWIIKLGLIVVGAILFFMGKLKRAAEVETTKKTAE